MISSELHVSERIPIVVSSTSEIFRPLLPLSSAVSKDSSNTEIDCYIYFQRKAPAVGTINCQNP